MAKREKRKSFLGWGAKREKSMDKLDLSGMPARTSLSNLVSPRHMLRHRSGRNPLEATASASHVEMREVMRGRSMPTPSPERGDTPDGDGPAGDGPAGGGLVLGGHAFINAAKFGLERADSAEARQLVRRQSLHDHMGAEELRMSREAVKRDKAMRKGAKARRSAARELKKQAKALPKDERALFLQDAVAKERRHHTFAIAAISPKVLPTSEETVVAADLRRGLERYAAVIREVDDSALLPPLLEKAASMLSTVEDLDASLARNLKKRVADPFKAMMTSSPESQSAEGLRAFNKQEHVNTVRDLVALLEVYRSYYSIGLKHIAEVHEAVIDARSLSTLHDEELAVPEIGSEFEVPPRMIVKQQRVAIRHAIHFSKFTKCWAVLTPRVLYFFTDMNAWEVQFVVLLDNADVTEVDGMDNGSDRKDAKGAGDGEKKCLQVCCPALDQPLVMRVPNILHCRSWVSAVDSCVLRRSMNEEVVRSNIELTHVTVMGEQAKPAVPSPGMSPLMMAAAADKREVPRSLEEFFDSNQFSKYWRDFRAKKHAMLGFILQPANVTKLIRYLLMDESLARKSQKSTDQRQLQLEYAGLAASVFTFDAVMTGSLFGMPGESKDLQMIRNELVYQFFSFLKKPSPLPHTETGFFCEVLRAMLKWQPMRVHDYLRMHPDIFDSLIAHLDDEQILKTLMTDFCTYKQSTAQMQALNMVGTRCLRVFLSGQCDDGHETFENSSVFLRVLLNHFRLFFEDDEAAERAAAAGGQDDGQNDEQPFLTMWAHANTINNLMGKVLDGSGSTALHAVHLLCLLFSIYKNQHTGGSSSGSSKPHACIRGAAAQLGQVNSSLQQAIAACAAVDSRAAPDAEVEGECESLVTFGFRRLALVKMLRGLLDTEFRDVNKVVRESGVLAACCELFFRYPSNNILQCELLSIFEGIFSNKRHKKLANAIVDLEFPQRLARAILLSLDPPDARPLSFGNWVAAAQCLSSSDMFRDKDTEVWADFEGSALPKLTTERQFAVTKPDDVRRNDDVSSARREQTSRMSRGDFRFLISSA